MQIKLDRIKEMIVKLKEWWLPLAAREKQAVILGGSCTFIFLVYALWWSPLNTTNATLRKRIITQQKNLIWMQAADKELSKLQSQSPSQAPTSIVSLLSAIQKQITRFALQQQLTQLKQGSNHSIEIHFQKVEFDKLMQFLISSTKDYHLTLTHFSVTADSTPGLVNADLLLS